ncbi:hypothetical protein ACHQM5_004244 [Ranunculus cassubicifolius]
MAASSHALHSVTVNHASHSLLEFLFVVSQVIEGSEYLFVGLGVFHNFSICLKRDDLSDSLASHGQG